MKKNGSVYVVVVFAALTGYFVYQWWFNPNRMVKARLGDIAAALSIPSGEADLGRVTRLAQIRKFAAVDVHVRIGKSGANLTSRDELLAAISAFRAPAGGWNVDFVNSDVRVNSDGTARAFTTADVTTRDPQTGTQTIDSREVTFSFVKQDRDWLVSEAEVKDLPDAAPR
jgi:hypothetical protein